MDGWAPSDPQGHVPDTDALSTSAGFGFVPRAAGRCGGIAFGIGQRSAGFLRSGEHKGATDRPLHLPVPTPRGAPSCRKHRAVTKTMRSSNES